MIQYLEFESKNNIDSILFFTFQLKCLSEVFLSKIIVENNSQPAMEQRGGLTLQIILNTQKEAHAHYWDVTCLFNQALKEVQKCMLFNVCVYFIEQY